jgi:peptide/nickel transport system substrate-binding protein
MDTVRLALFSVDPPGLSFFHIFDPESYSVITAINDALVYVDEEGELRPGLATSWRYLSPVAIELELREGVRFHNGDVFDAEDVVATFRAHKEPTPSPGGAGLFAIIANVRATGPLRVVFELTRPDAMFLRALCFGSIYPKGVIEREGRDSFLRTPIGTGAYRMVRYEPGREIVLERNVDHWAKRATVDCIRLPIMRQKEWIDRLARGDIDAAWNLDSHDRVRAARLPGITAASRAAALSQWFIIANKGPLADVRVRRALNHAVHRRLLVDLSEHGYGSPQKSVATREQEGFTETEAYRYCPELSRALLEEAGAAEGFTLRGIVSETSTAVYFAVREFLSRINVRLEANIVPRTELLKTLIESRANGQPYAGDFAVVSVDNPLLHSLFAQFSFVFSGGTFSLTEDPTYDQKFLAAMANTEQPREAQEELEHYVRDNALLLFTVQQDVHAAWRDGMSTLLPRSGHFDTTAFWSLRCPTPLPRNTLPPVTRPSLPDVAHLLESTSHTGAFYMRPDVKLEEPTGRAHLAKHLGRRAALAHPERADAPLARRAGGGEDEPHERARLDGSRGHRRLLAAGSKALLEPRLRAHVRRPRALGRAGSRARWTARLERDPRGRRRDRLVARPRRVARERQTRWRALEALSHRHVRARRRRHAHRLHARLHGSLRRGGAHPQRRDPHHPRQRALRPLRARRGGQHEERLLRLVPRDLRRARRRRPRGARAGGDPRPPRAGREPLPRLFSAGLRRHHAGGGVARSDPGARDHRRAHVLASRLRDPRRPG